MFDMMIDVGPKVYSAPPATHVLDLLPHPDPCFRPKVKVTDFDILC